MFNLKWLACSLMVVSFAMVSNAANAQDYWNVRRNSSCNQTNGYPASGLPSYRNSFPSYGNYPSRAFQGYMPNRSDMQPYSAQRHFQEQSLYDRSAPSPYRYDNRPMTWEGSSLSGYRSRNSAAVYDSLHGDYHTVPQAQSYPTSTSQTNWHMSPQERSPLRGYSGW